MMKNVLPILACLVAGSTALAQNSADTQTDTRMEVRKEIRLGMPNFFQGTGSFLGVYPAEITVENAGKYGLADDPHGALLDKVVENTPASKAGLQENDVIVEWNGMRVESAAQLRRLINETPTGRKVTIGYLRNGVRMSTESALDQRPEPEMKMLIDSTMCFPKGFPEGLEKMMENGPRIGMRRMMVGNGRMGASLQNITPQLAKYFGVNEGTGALVGAVKEGSAAEKAGLQAGDIIIQVAGEKVQQPGDVARTLSKKDAGDVELKVIRDKSEKTITVKLEGPAMNQNPEFPGFNFNGMEKLDNETLQKLRELPNGMQFMMPDQEFEIMIHPDAPEGDTETPVAPEMGDPDLGDNLIPRERLRNEKGMEFKMRRIPGDSITLQTVAKATEKIDI